MRYPSTPVALETSAEPHQKLIETLEEADSKRREKEGDACMNHPFTPALSLGSVFFRKPKTKSIPCKSGCSVLLGPTAKPANTHVLEYLARPSFWAPTVAVMQTMHFRTWVTLALNIWSFAHVSWHAFVSQPTQFTTKFDVFILMARELG